jgi:hypothetical protein
MKRTATRILLTLIVVGSSLVTVADETSEPGRNIDGISDNSFFIEEAYNQLPGEVQHVVTIEGLREKSGEDEEFWEIAFTQEWPLFSQKHQISYTVPYDFVCGDGSSENGLGDVSLSYRYQAYLNEETLTAFAPTLSVILPTGDEDDGLGEDTFGWEFSLPFSTTFGDKWFAHFNAGVTYLPEAASADDRDLWHYGMGASVIYAATPRTHFLLEWIGEWEEGLDSSDRRRHEFASFISPGVRTAFNFANDSQLVLGVGVPIGITDSAPDYGVFVYVSFEHLFSRKNVEN